MSKELLSLSSDCAQHTFPN